MHDAEMLADLGTAIDIPTDAELNEMARRSTPRGYRFAPSGEFVIDREANRLIDCENVVVARDHAACLNVLSLVRAG